MELERIAPNFDQRLGAQRSFEEKSIEHRIESSQWILVGGDYSLDQIVRGHVPTESFRGPRMRRIRLSRYEIFLRDQMQAALSQKGDHPAVFLDIGGGAGESWAKLALYFRKEIERGEAVFTVSNLVFEPEQYYPYFRLADNVDTNVIYARNNGLVQYLKSSFSDLGTAEITLPDGKVRQLQGNVNLINENKSLSNWTQIPEVDIPVAGSLLTPYGVYLVKADDVNIAATGQDKQNKKDLQNGKAIAYDTLRTRYNITSVTTVEAGAQAGSELLYIANKKPLTPAITVN